MKKIVAGAALSITMLMTTVSPSNAIQLIPQRADIAPPVATVKVVFLDEDITNVATIIPNDPAEMEASDSNSERGIKIWTDADAEMLARTVWGEARGCSELQRAAVVWCILNRVDSQKFPNTISEVVTQPWQFSGYSSNNPIEDDILELVVDVLIRWSAEGSGITVGRILPKEYLYFSGNGKYNTYTTQYGGKDFWDWSMENPYV